MRTGAVGNRSAEDMVKTLVEPKKSAISSIRQKLLAAGYSEEVEYDSVNIEPVLIYSVSERNALFVKHKWELTALIPLSSEIKKEPFATSKEDLSKYEYVDDDGNRWLKFDLPEDEELILQILSRF
ncbi:MAG: hypothetical protein JRN15_06220 [Nitrososphaerota archaeon]|nr:hypothetical protein [Nitrososphaerota archaeon]